MDALKYKDYAVRRGYNYHYYYSPAVSGKPTLLFIHGFPSTSFDWSRQVAFFEANGYGLLVPDCLGYGGTSKPTHHEEFRWKLIAQDLIDILDAEHLDTVVGIGHDWFVFPFPYHTKTILTRFDDWQGIGSALHAGSLSPRTVPRIRVDCSVLHGANYDRVRGG